MEENKLSNGNIYVGSSNEAKEVLHIIMDFLTLFMPMTLVRRVVSIVLLAAGLSIEQIEFLTGLTGRSVRNYGRTVRNGDTAELLTLKEGRGRKSKASGIEDQILTEIETGHYHTRQQIADMVKEKFGISMSLMAVSRLLKKNGIKRLKSGSLPAKADMEKQRQFHDNTLQPLMKKAQKGEIVLLFMDASHFVMGCDFLGYIYGRTRRFVLTFSGRKRYNVLGAIDFVSKRVLTVTNDSYITVAEVCKILSKIAQEYEGKTVHVILDNAKYQKCIAVQKHISKLDIVLDYIPPYSPNLNLIERLWKFVKGELRTKYYNDFPTFMARIDSLIDSTTKENYFRICTLIGAKIQLFDNCHLFTNNVHEVTNVA